MSPRRAAPEVTRRHLKGFKGTVGKDSFGATNGIGSAEQVCLQHYSREIGRALDLKNPGDEFRRRMAPTLIRILGDARRADKHKSKKRRLVCKKRPEAHVGRMARVERSDPHCGRFAKPFGGSAARCSRSSPSTRSSGTTTAPSGPL